MFKKSSNTLFTHSLEVRKVEEEEASETEGEGDGPGDEVVQPAVHTLAIHHQLDV